MEVLWLSGTAEKEASYEQASRRHERTRRKVGTMCAIALTGDWQTADECCTR